MTLSEIKEKAGGCDFLKIDCEGGEWFIKPEELDGIRQIEGEFHYSSKMKDQYGLLEYIKKNFQCSLVEIKINSSEIDSLILIHAERK